MDYDLRPLWDAILALYHRFEAYCKEHEYRYYVTGGTLLGAIRHDGFIPWDDDFDVVMPRPDYMRFLREWNSTSIPNCKLKSIESSNGWSQLFAKIIESDQTVVSSVEKASGLMLGDGICIDVIPIDGMPKATLLFYYWALKRSTWRHQRSKNPLWRLLLMLLWRNDRSSSAFQRWLASYDYDTSPCVEDYNANGRRFRMRCLSAQSFGEPIMHKFDRINVPIPSEWDKFLFCIYGPNYMTLPPQEKRIPSHMRNGNV